MSGRRSASRYWLASCCSGSSRSASSNVAGLRGGEDHERVKELGVVQRERPCRRGAPVVAHEHQALVAELLDQGADVPRGCPRAVLVQVLGLGGEVKAAQIRGHDEPLHQSPGALDCRGREGGDISHGHPPERCPQG